ncbi:class IV lanthionine synthetase LanL [Actinopolymorpha sp. B9G3]|uniref:class IV lanthionine synthetase LanL n=1 Tax=Actinopolymorpha sp. B9G3 TaxID=3158970 RepID=UPI0032D99E09
MHPVRELLGEGDWDFRIDPPWCAVVPAGHQGRTHGWLLHLSATPASATSVLAHAVPVLREHGVAFRFAVSTAAVRWLTGEDCDPRVSGRFLTVYPRDDAEAPHLATALHAATAGLPGPRILADRPVRSSSLVHYRYGRFEDAYDLDDDGVLRPVDLDAVAVLGPSPPVHAIPHIQPGTVLHGRFVLRRIIDQSVTGGRYLALDRTNDREVLVKHARAHSGGDHTGADARERLQLEAAALRHLAGEVPVPRVFEVFDQDGDRFLTTEHPPGRPFLDWVHATHREAVVNPTGHILLMARRLVALVAGVHAAGIVLRNLSPGSVLVAPNGALTLVDLEAAVPAGQPAPPPWPSSYLAPECRDPRQVAGVDGSLTATVAEDLWSLGALFFLLATGTEPDLPLDVPADRPIRDRLAAWLSVVARDHPSAAVVAPPLLGLLATAPDCRWSLSRVEKYLASPERRSTGAGGHSGVRLPTVAQLVSDGLDHLRDAAAVPPDSDIRADPTDSGTDVRTDPGTVRHGAAGVLGTLIQASMSARDQDRLLAAVREVSARLVAHRPPGQSGRALPGLLTGRAGTAWALADAGVALDDPALVAEARAMVSSLPTDWPLPGVAHGLAGAGLAHLHIGRLTGDEELLDRAQGYADAVVAAAHLGAHGPLWPVPADARSALAGSCHYGFAHGVAGIGYFLLLMAHETGDESYAKVAVAAGHTLCEAATTDTDGAAWWPAGLDHPAPSPHRSAGPAGIGTFLLRQYAVTGEPGIGAYAVAAAVAVHKARWRVRSDGCHGLAGSGHYLLDAAQVLGDDTYRTWAGEVAEAMAVRHCRRAGRLLVPDQVAPPVSTGVADGGVRNAGTGGETDVADSVSFLLRLLRGGPRPWMVDGCLADRALEIAGEDLRPS